MLNLRYRGQFLAIDGTLWQADILQEGYAGAVGELTFEADEPLVIEWRETRKEEVICSSEATLRIESPGDRTYADLYAIEPGQIRLDVRRNGTLYWSGTLDTEFYEEPYERARLYPVTLTFSDFGILDRLKFGGMEGNVTLRYLISKAVTRCHLNYGGLDTSLISTALKGSSVPLSLDDLSVMALNFYDEDGDALTLREAIEGVLQPLGLKMQQRAGRVWIYDLNGLYEVGARRAIEWDGAEQTLGTDRVYNNANITWSPYVKSGNLMEEDCWVKDTDPNETALNEAYGRTVEADSTSAVQIWSYHYSTDPADWKDGTDCGFTLWTCPEGKNATLATDAGQGLGYGPRFFRIVAQEDGDDSQGIAIRWPGAYMPEQASSAMVVSHGPGWSKGGYESNVGSALWTSQAVSLPPVSQPGALRLHLTLDMLMDCRINPFEEATDIYSGILECKQWAEQWKARGNFVYVPVRITFRPDGTDDTYTWTNIDGISANVTNFPRTSLAWAIGRWTAGATAHGYLAWYSASDRDGDTGVMGWQPCRPAINPHTARLNTALKALGTGQWIPMPLEAWRGGVLTIEVMSDGWMLADGNVTLQKTESPDPHGLWTGKTPWCLMKLPQLEVRLARTYDSELDDSDVEYQAEINPDAREGLELQTICGTADEPVPMARGAYLLAANSMPVCHLTRAGRTATAEQLLIGTLYSQYASRHTTLRGEARLDPLGLATYAERNQGDRRFIALSEIQDVRMGTAECLYCELSADEYDKG